MAGPASDNQDEESWIEVGVFGAELQAVPPTMIDAFQARPMNPTTNTSRGYCHEI